MAQWHKLILSGGAASVSSLYSSGAITNNSTVAATKVTGSFTGSFKGDGSQLTGLASAPISSYTNPSNDRIITSVNASTVNAEANLTFNGSILGVVGTVNASGALTGSKLRLSAIAAGTDNSVVVATATGELVTDEIDSRVWGSSLVDFTGTPVDNQLAVWTDSNTVEGTTGLTYAASSLGVTGKGVFTTSVTASAFRATTLPAGVDNTVLVVTAAGDFVTDEIDPRVWGATLVDKTGTPVDNQIAVWTDADTVEGTAGLTYSGTSLGVTGTGIFSGKVTATTFNATTMAAGTDNSVVVLSSGGDLVTDEIDPRVWGASLIDGAGAATRVTYWTDASKVTSNASFTYNGTLLTVGTSTFGTDVIVAGNLTVQGDTFNVNVANLSVEDRFILLNSGSASGDGGIIVQNHATAQGFAFGFDDSVSRWGFQGNTELAGNATAIAPEAYASMVVDQDAGHTDLALYQKNGNIRVNAGEIFIYA